MKSNQMKNNNSAFLKVNRSTTGVALGVLLMVVGLLSGCSDGTSDKPSAKKTWLLSFMESELDSLIANNAEGTKITMITDADGVSNDNGQGLETEKFQQMDYRAELDGIMEYARMNIEDGNKFEKWVDSSVNRQGLWMRITHYLAKDTNSGLQAVDIYELEDRKSDLAVYTIPKVGNLPIALDKDSSGAMGARTYNCYLVTWDYKQRTWWIDRDVRAYYQKGAQAFGYKIRENAIWGSAKGIDIQINLSNELWLNND